MSAPGKYEPVPTTTTIASLDLENGNGGHSKRSGAKQDEDEEEEHLHDHSPSISAPSKVVPPGEFRLLLFRVFAVFVMLIVLIVVVISEKDATAAERKAETRVNDVPNIELGLPGAAGQTSKKASPTDEEDDLEDEDDNGQLEPSELVGVTVEVDDQESGAMQVTIDSENGTEIVVGVDQISPNGTISDSASEMAEETIESSATSEEGDAKKKSSTPKLISAESPFLNGDIKCIPRYCASPKHFIEDSGHLALPHAFTLLASFPGSGNTWTRTIIEEGTRLWTGSSYYDINLLKDGFIGEGISAFEGSHPRVAAIKTHFPYYLQYGPSVKTRATILILRSPFDAMLSEFNREFGRGTHKHTNVASLHLLQTFLPNWYKIRGNMWRKFMGHWLGPNFWIAGNSSFLLSRNDTNGVTSLMTRKKLRVLEHREIPIFVMFYEDFISNFADSVGTLFTFMKKYLGKAMPTVEAAVICALKHHTKEILEMRHHDTAKAYNPFFDPEGVGKTTSIAEFCELVKDFWVTEKWGECTGQLQIYRSTAKYAAPVLPENKC